MQALRSTFRQQIITLDLRLAAGRVVRRLGPTAAGRIYHRAKSTMCYWKIRSITPLNQYYLHGRNPKRRSISIEREVEVSEFIQFSLQQNPQRTCRDLCVLVLQRFTIVCTVSTMFRFMTKIGLSFKNTAVTQAHKYRADNVQRYIEYIHYIPFIDREQLYYLDESHFRPRDLQLRRCWSPVGVRQRVLNHGNLNQWGVSMTMITSILPNRHPLFWEIRRGTNTQEDFVVFILSAVRTGFIRPGATVIMDNASIHRSQFATDVMDFIHQELDISFVMLPAYSPELNPIEKVFSVMKQNIRRNQFDDVITAMNNAAQEITREQLINMYDHCIDLHFHDRFIDHIE